MGRYIYAETVGIDKNDTTVHKFWFAVQNSDVSEYLDMYEPNYFLADLSVGNEADIREKVTELKEVFKKEYGTTYEEFMESGKNGRTMPEPEEELASRINLGEHLLETIANMKAAKIEGQQLTIEC